MFSYSAKKSALFQELEDEERVKLFSYKGKKFLHNIDSFYYVVKVKNDWNFDSGCQEFLSYLEMYRKSAIKQFDPFVCFQVHDKVSHLGTGFVMNGIGSAPYLYDIQKPDKYIMFFANNILNPNMPEVWVQLRSQNLWLNGVYSAFEESLTDLQRIFDTFGIQIEKVSENRIDYAYHTNYIQDMTNYFKPENFNRMQQSRFARWSLEGAFKGQFDTDADYFTLGRKKSNNLFFRVYNKTKEVIEQGYKQFFIKLWYLENMISFFDLYCIEKAFLSTSYKALQLARLEFYLEYGSDPVLKDKCKTLLQADSLDYDQIESFADFLVPKVTLILNVEFETKRKFYYSFDESIGILLKVHSKNVPEFAKKIYLILDNLQVFHDYISCNNDRNDGVIRFIDFKAKNRFGRPWTEKSKFPTADWWKRLQSVRVNRKFKADHVDLIRKYQKSLSVDILRKRIINMMGTHSLYVRGENDSDTFSDCADFLSLLNENDIERAIDYKQKKMTLLADRLGDVQGSFQRTVNIVDQETGQIF